jgi:hypothetical protein
VERGENPHLRRAVEQCETQRREQMRGQLLTSRRVAHDLAEGRVVPERLESGNRLRRALARLQGLQVREVIFADVVLDRLARHTLGHMECRILVARLAFHGESSLALRILPARR